MTRKNSRPCAWGAGLSALASVWIATSPTLAAPRVPTHVACVGDSITYGYLASNPATKSYPANLQTLFGAGVQVKNFGRNSATMLSGPYGDTPYVNQPEYAAATSFVSSAGASAVTSVIIMLGTNDSKPQNWTPSGKPKNDQQYLSDYRAMVEHFSALTPKPLVYLALPLATGSSPCCSIDGKVIHDEVIPLIKQLALEKQLPTIDLNTPTANHPEYFADGVHPTDAAYAIVAGLMHDGLLAEPSSAGADSGGSGSGGGASAGSAGLASAGSAGAQSAGGGSLNAGGTSGVAGAAIAGAGLGGANADAGQTAGAGGGVAGTSPNSAGNSAVSANSGGGGCAVSGRARATFSSSALVALGLTLLAARRRRAQPRMC